jgi:hypothetical protein
MDENRSFLLPENLRRYLGVDTSDAGGYTPAQGHHPQPHGPGQGDGPHGGLEHGGNDTPHANGPGAGQRNAWLERLEGPLTRQIESHETALNVRGASELVKDGDFQEANLKHAING